MFTRKTESNEMVLQPPPLPTPAEAVKSIADGVARGTKLQLAETAIATLRARRDALVTEERALINDARRSVDGTGNEKGKRERINGLETEIRALEKQINGDRPKLSELHRARADRVNEALLPTQKEAAARIVAAYEELTAATDVLIACNDEIRKAGNPDRPYLNHVAGVSLIDHARWLLK